MARNKVRFQKGLGTTEFLKRYGTEEQHAYPFSSGSYVRSVKPKAHVIVPLARPCI